MCPLTGDHVAGWRCYAMYAIDAIVCHWPERFPWWPIRPLMQLMSWLDEPAKAAET